MTAEIIVTKTFDCPALERKLYIRGHYQIPKDEKSKDPAIFLYAECQKVIAKPGKKEIINIDCNRLPSECGCYNIYPRQISDPYRHAR